VLDMEEKFCSVSLDIIGRAVFNYDFGSTNKESPVIKVRIFASGSLKANAELMQMSLCHLQLRLWIHQQGVASHQGEDLC
jgi:hypothetical protein